ncbi:MAG: UDP-N-acetylmuramate dehydrogenase [Candidatus Omnitrophica bacterium]|nr:UDP-N-acetylmuramate dehydrogenase [Candidatus Omnitrophota bacterium]
MNLSILQELGIKVTPHALLRDHTTFKLGGACKAMIECQNAQEMTAAIKALRKIHASFLVMGFGSNILASDNGIDKIIVRYTTNTPLIEQKGNRLTVDAATQFDDLARFAINAGLDGMTTFSGIPGTVGGAIAGNAGAYGKQISDSLVSLTLLKPDNTVISVPKSAISFSYRDSDIKHSNDIILNAEFELPSGDTKTMLQKREETIRTREEKHGRWQDSPSAGSFFRNVEPTSKAGPRQSAGWFLDQAGAKDLRVGGAHSYKNHANIITRDDNAKAEDVLALTLQMMAMVEKKFSIKLIREVRLLGEFKNLPVSNPKGYS